MDYISIGLALSAGLLSFISPCVLPLVPAYIGYMGGRLTHNVSRQGQRDQTGLAFRLQMLTHGLAFVLGFTLVFVLIGLLTTALSSLAGQSVGAFTETIGRVGGLVIIFFGFQFMGLLPHAINWLRRKGQAALLDNAVFSLAALAVSAALLYWALLGQAGDRPAAHCRAGSGHGAGRGLHATGALLEQPVRSAASDAIR